MTKTRLIGIKKEKELTSCYTSKIYLAIFALFIWLHSNIRRDLQCIKHEAKIKIEKYLREDVLFNYLRYMAGSNEMTRQLWEIVQYSDTTTTREKTNALSCLLQSYNSRLQTLTAGPESYMNIILV